MRKNCLKYPVEIVDDVFGESSVLADVVRSVTDCEEPRVLLVADGNVVQRTEGLGTKIGRYLTARNIVLAGASVILSGGEKIKADGLQCLQRVLSALVTARAASANGCVLALGGGTVLDVAGYAVAQVPGWRVVRLPTTPAALFDAAFATRAALDCDGCKDALSLSAEPAAVLLDPLFATTVLDGVWRAGFGEAVRLAVATNAALLARLGELAPSVRTREASALSTVLEDVVALRRRGATTNLAQRTSARLEELSGFKLPHGYAVSIAVAVEAAYAAARGLMSEADASAVRDVLTRCGALDGLEHSRHLLERSDELLAARFGVSGDPEPLLVSGGATALDENPSEALYQQALNLIKYTP